MPGVRIQPPSPVILDLEDAMPYRKPCGSVLEAIGNTPLVRLRRVIPDLPGNGA